MLIEWSEGDQRHAVEVPAPYDALACARVLAADLGVAVHVGGHRVPGDPSPEDRRAFERWQAGGPAWEAS